MRYGRKSKKVVSGGTDDQAVVKAIEVLKGHFSVRKNRPRRTPYYHHQLQVLYEGDFFEWVIGNALKKLVDSGYLTRFDKKNVPELAGRNMISNVIFYANSKAVETGPDWDRMKKRVVNIARVIREYSTDRNNDARGKQLESLVKSRLEASQFEIIGRNIRTYEDKKWTKTNHELDFIARKIGTDFVIGVEVKNTMALMDKKEIDIKIDMCEHLGIVPVFAVRWIKPYLNHIRNRGGFSWIFKTQIHPFGYEQDVRKWYKKFSILPKTKGGLCLKYPITVRGDLPQKSIEKFQEWVQRQEKSRMVGGA